MVRRLDGSTDQEDHGRGRPESPRVMLRRGPRRRAPVGALALAGLVAAALLSGCGDSGTPPERVSDRDARAIFSRLGEGQILVPERCWEMRRPLRPATMQAFSTMIRVARKNPDALLGDPDFPDDPSLAIRSWLGGMAETIRTCAGKVPPGRGWMELQARLDEAAKAP